MKKEKKEKKEKKKVRYKLNLKNLILKIMKYIT